MDSSSGFTKYKKPTSISESSLAEGSSSVEAKTVTYIETPTYRRMRNKEYNGVKLLKENK